MKCSGLKRLSLSVLLALGISPAFADELSNSDPRQVKYGGILTLDGFYGNDGNSYASGDLWQPLWQEWNKVAFLDMRGIKGENQIWEGNLGGGYRWLSPEAEYLYGVYAFYDSRNSILGNAFQQGTMGGEFKGEHWSLTGNAYIPFGTTKYYDSGLDQAELTSVQADGSQNLLISNGFEQSLMGFDLEAGYDIPYARGLRMYGAYYYFIPPAGVAAVQGPRISTEYRLDQALNWNVNWVNRFSFKASWQYDQVRGNLWTAGFELALPLSRAARNSTASMSLLQQQMTAFIRRDVDVVTIQDGEDFAPYQLNGHNAKIYFVNNGTELATQSQSAQADIIVIGQNITTTQSTILSNNQVVTGQNIEYKPGVLFNATGLATPTTISQSTPSANTFVVGSGNTIRDLNIQYPNGPGINVFSISNNATKSVGTLLIDSVTTNAPVSINVGDGGTSSNITIENSTFNIAQINSAVNTAINITASNNSTVNVAAISGNIITFGSGAGSLTGIFFQNQSGATGVIGNIDGNTITFQNGSSNTGIAIQTGPTYPATELSTIVDPLTIASIINNTITLGVGPNNKGISVVNNSADNTTAQTVKAISSNTIKVGGGATGAGNQTYGIFLSNESNGIQEVSAVKNNKIQFLSGDYNQGLYINNSNQFTTQQNKTKGFQIIGGVSDNVFIFPVTSTGANSNAIAVYIDGSLADFDVPVTTILGLNGNSSNNAAIGILFSNLRLGIEPNVILVNIGGSDATCQIKASTCKVALSNANDGMNVTNNANAFIF